MPRRSLVRRRQGKCFLEISASLIINTIFCIDSYKGPGICLWDLCQWHEDLQRGYPENWGCLGMFSALIDSTSVNKHFTTESWWSYPSECQHTRLHHRLPSLAYYRQHFSLVHVAGQVRSMLLLVFPWAVFPRSFGRSNPIHVHIPTDTILSRRSVFCERGL